MPDRLGRGDRVSLRFSKYDGSPHWQYEATFLGTDEHGAWLRGGPGTVIARPGRRMVWDGDFVVLVPPDRGFALTLNAPTRLVRAEVYIDITTVPTWHSGEGSGMATVQAVDLDLDVVRHFGESEPFVEDEDEFDDHRMSLGYPPELVTAAKTEAARVLQELSAGVEPFHTRAHRWLELAGTPVRPQ